MTKATWTPAGPRQTANYLGSELTVHPSKTMSQLDGGVRLWSCHVRKQSKSFTAHVWDSSLCTCTPEEIAYVCTDGKTPSKHMHLRKEEQPGGYSTFAKHDFVDAASAQEAAEAHAENWATAEDHAA